MLRIPLIAAGLAHHPVTRSMVCAAVLVAMGVSRDVAAQAPATAAGIYSCVDASGKRLTSDRPIAECLDREQRVLNKDGSVRAVVPPRMSAKEKAERDARLRDQSLAEAARKDAIRRDRNLLMRYPDEGAHNRARQAAMDELLAGIEQSERRIQVLRTERKPLDSESEFYAGKRLPPKLRGQIEANEAQQQAQRDIIQQQRTEMSRLNAIYDAELTHLRPMWAGAAPGAAAASAASSAPGVKRPASSSAVR